MLARTGTLSIELDPGAHARRRYRPGRRIDVVALTERISRHGHQQAAGDHLLDTAGKGAVRGTIPPGLVFDHAKIAFHDDLLPTFLQGFMHPSVAAHLLVDA